ncbi:MAG: hypothetical protein IJS81_02025 [Selenomonadaceae bacterium]|nr:hypothetical protein [Selenomonadaceae bacterium]MBR0287831.1 hypothetical protein [Selenomonadaceae bacterium]
MIAYGMVISPVGVGTFTNRAGLTGIDAMTNCAEMPDLKLDSDAGNFFSQQRRYKVHNGDCHEYLNRTVFILRLMLELAMNFPTKTNCAPKLANTMRSILRRKLL